MFLGNSSSPPTAPISCGSISPTRRQHCVAKPGPHPLVTSLLRFFVYDEKCDPLFSAPYTLFLICNSFKPLYFVVPAHSLRKTPGGGGPHTFTISGTRAIPLECVSPPERKQRASGHTTPYRGRSLQTSCVLAPQFTSVQRRRSLLPPTPVCGFAPALLPFVTFCGTMPPTEGMPLTYPSRPVSREQLVFGTSPHPARGAYHD
jgi:hypothetical protein